ncbi:MAG: hypothetical protein A3F46_10965 [Legionellales bacterium RIFCSPHIGHO2_12_FULL_42_9]|nr:MAG: hypothetical protein A3F46_10965 [Legionellales bacterium RIFCSPHIGHO2_12_FULL_42_9]
MGFDFAIYNCRRVVNGGAVAKLWVLLSELQVDEVNLAALSALLEARMQDIATLHERLATPLENWDLDTTHEMS